MELQSRAAELEARGLGLVGMTYDDPEILAAFTARQGITFPLLSDTGSAYIKQLGLLNTTVAEDSRIHGIPFPGTFVLAPDGTIKERFFENSYRERLTMSTIDIVMGNVPMGEGTRIAGRHMEVLVAGSDELIAPGNRFALVLEFHPGENVHVYAPGETKYRVLDVQIDDSDGLLQTHPVQYPEPEEYHFVPRDERVKVYQQPFTVVQEVTLKATDEAQEALAGREALTITGTINYQACDDTVCYNPTSIPVSWLMTLRPLDRVRARQ